MQNRKTNRLLQYEKRADENNILAILEACADSGSKDQSRHALDLLVF